MGQSRPTETISGRFPGLSTIPCSRLRFRMRCSSAGLPETCFPRNGSFSTFHFGQAEKRDPKNRRKYRPLRIRI